MMVEPEDDLVDVLNNALGRPDIKALRWAKHRGINEPLARHIETGGHLGPETRAWLAEFLRGRAPRGPRGTKRTPAQIKADRDLLLEIWRRQEVHGSTFNMALKSYLDDHPDAKEETIRCALKRARHDRPMPV